MTGRHGGDVRPHRSCILSADGVLVNTSTSLVDAQVRVVDGRIAHTGHNLTKQFPDDPVYSYPGCVLIPGLVNAHSHIELTLLRGTGRGLNFPDWISRVTQEIQSHEIEFFQNSAQAGLKECIQGGVTTLADHSTLGVSAQVLSQSGLTSVIYHEVFCIDPDEDHSQKLDDLDSLLSRNSVYVNENISLGISCHASYNAAKPALEAIVRRFKDFPRSIHAAESPDEMSYIRSASGFFADRHRDRGMNVRAWGMSPVEYLDNCSYWHSGSQAVHLTQASKGDLTVLKTRSASAAFCPISNAYLGCGIPPIAQARRVGLLCGIGTDSALSSEQQDLFDEMRFAVLGSRLKADPITAADAFQMATIEGARSLGYDDRGTLEPGMRADIVALSLPYPDSGENLVDTVVWQGSASGIKAVWAKGCLIHTTEGDRL